MKRFHSAELVCFSKPEDDHIHDEELFLSVFGFELESRNIQQVVQGAKGFNERNIIIRRVKLEKDKDINDLVTKLNKELQEDDKKRLREEKNRLDEKLHFFIRLDKDALKKGLFELTDSGNCIKIEFVVAAYPKNEEVALRVVKETFK